MLTVARLWSPFGSGRRGLEAISIQVSIGKFVALVGRNGSGKSTLLRSIAGYHKVEHGTIHVGAMRIDVLPAHRRSERVVLVEQGMGVGLPMHMSIGEVLGLWMERDRNALGLLQWRKFRSRLDGLLQEYLPSFAGRLDDQLLTLSGGERQLLSLACLRARLESVQRKGFVILLDEHTANLDSVLAERVMSESRLLVRQHDACGLVVTHQLGLAVRSADRIIVLNDGRIASSFDSDPNNESAHSQVERAVKLQFEQQLGLPERLTEDQQDQRLS